MGTTNILDMNNRISDLEKAVSGGDSAQANKKDIATEFSATTAYTAGCFVYYQGKLYQFNADHSAGAWDPTDVVEANVTDQIVSNASAITELDNKVDEATDMASGSFTGNLGFTFNWSKYGKIVSFHAGNNATPIPQGDNIIGDVPDDILPMIPTTFDCNRSFVNKCSFIINTSTKKISVYCDIPTGSSSPYYVQGNVTYICN